MQPARLLTACLLLLAAPALGAPEAAAQGRFEDKTEAERAFLRGQQLEDEAASFKANDNPEDAADRYRDAIAAYTDALRQEPGMIAAFVRMGYAYYALEQPDKAEAVLKPAIARWPDSAALKRVYGTVLFNLKGRRKEAVHHLEQAADANQDADWYDVLFLLAKHYYEADDLERAARTFRRYLKQQPNDAASHGTLGNIYLKSGKFEPAIAEFRTVLSLQPGNLPARTNIANIYFKQEDYPRAIAAFTAILKDHPGQLGVRFNLASAQFQSKAYKESLENYAIFAKARPASPAGHYWVGACHDALRQPGPARAAFKAALTADPRHARARYRLALLDLREGRPQPALDLLEAARPLAPDDPWILIALGDAHRDLNHLDKAEATHRQALQLAPSEPAAHVALARDLFALQRWPQTVEALQQADRHAASKDPAIHQLLAVALVRRGRDALTSGDLKQADADATHAASLDPNPLAPRLLLLATALQRGDVEKATTHLQAAQKLDPASPLVRHAAARLALRRNKPQEALTHLQPLLDPKGQAPTAPIATDLAITYAALQRYDDALASFTRAQTLDPANPAAEPHLALIHVLLGEHRAAADQWRPAADALEAADALRQHLTPLWQLRLDLALGAAYTELGALPKALKRLAAASRLLRDLPPDQRAALPADTLAIDLRLAFVHYRVNQLDDALKLLDRAPTTGPHARDAQLLLASVLNRQALLLFKAGKNAPARDLLQRAARASRADDTLAHNLAVLDYADGKGKRVGPAFQGFAAKGIPAALYNHAIYLDDIKKDKEAAYQAYQTCLQARCPQSDEATQAAAAKQRIFGFGPTPGAQP